ncbi:unnamed protein product [Lactuca saligna]|uniref:Uncharacterized protein n=1 Tax=Lactuca saligna TaxID=75948 RepID=A0AA35Z9E1_LACSI|nr:unnamed protein product [Lactuca saligna]
MRSKKTGGLELDLFVGQHHQEPSSGMYTLNYNLINSKAFPSIDSYGFLTDPRGYLTSLFFCISIGRRYTHKLPSKPAVVGVLLMDGSMTNLSLLDAKENKFLKGTFDVVGIMSTLVIYGVLQNCMENEFNIDHTREIFGIEFNNRYICEDQIDYMDH